MASSNILITGPPRVGKTTIVEKLVRLLSDLSVRGFFTREIREGGGRTGFGLHVIGGGRSVLSHVNLESRMRVGRYGVDVPGFDARLEEMDLDSPGCDVVVIDEIGKMECFSEKFKGIVKRLLDCDAVLAATVAARGGGFISEVRSRDDAIVVGVTRENRDELPARLEKAVREAAARRRGGAR